jgi:predicted branched-subunit amino acid permease
VVDIPTAIAGFAMTSLFIYLLYAQPHTRGTACAALGAVVTVALCKWNGMGGVAVPLAALVGVAAGMASGLAPRRHGGGCKNGDGEKSAAPSEPATGGDVR